MELGPDLLTGRASLSCCLADSCCSEKAAVVVAAVDVAAAADIAAADIVAVQVQVYLVGWDLLVEVLLGDRTWGLIDLNSLRVGLGGVTSPSRSST